MAQAVVLLSALLATLACTFCSLRGTVK